MAGGFKLPSKLPWRRRRGRSRQPAAAHRKGRGALQFAARDMGRRHPLQLGDHFVVIIVIHNNFSLSPFSFSVF
jgi:hypothetical protein